MDDAGIITLYWQREQAAVTETDKKYGGLCRSVSYRILTDREAGDAGLCFRICDPANAEEGFRSGTGSTPDENGGMLCGYVYAKTELGSGFTVEAYNCWTKEVYCRIELNAEA